MVFVVGWICVEAVQRLYEPVEVLATPMLVVAVVGLLVNVAAAAVLFGADRDNLNVRGALLHVLGDLLGSVAAISAAVVIMATGWMLIDPLLSFLVAALILRSTWFLIRDSGRILLEGTPVELDVREIGADLVEHLDAVEDVHHVHAWSLAQDRSLLTLHARIREGIDFRRRGRRHPSSSRGALRRDARHRPDRGRGLRRPRDGRARRDPRACGLTQTEHGWTFRSPPSTSASVRCGCAEGTPRSATVSAARVGAPSAPFGVP